MNISFIPFAYLLLATWTAAGQSADRTKPSSKAAGLGRPEAAASEEMNIRAYIELLRSDIKKSRSQIIGTVMQLDADEATKFWPIYKEFESEYTKLGDQVVAVVKKYAENYDSMTDAVAAELGNQVLSVEDQRNALKKRYFDRMKESLGAITATRFLQVENQLERILDLQVAAELPIVK